MGPGAVGAKRVDWTIHIGIAIRSIADLMGLVTRFERGSRKDAILRSTDGDEIAIEWEWEGVWGQNELGKLKDHRVWSPPPVKIKNPERLLRYGVLITYTHTPNIDKVCEHVTSKWKDAKWPLLLILIDLDENKKFGSGKEFKYLNMLVFDCQGMKQQLRATPAYPWKVDCSRWVAQTV